MYREEKWSGSNRIMDPPVESDQLADFKVPMDAIVDSVAEDILGQEKSVAVVDSNHEVVGTLHSSRVLKMLFGGRLENPH